MGGPIASSAYIFIHFLAVEIFVQLLLRSYWYFHLSGLRSTESEFASFHFEFINLFNNIRISFARTAYFRVTGIPVV